LNVVCPALAIVEIADFVAKLVVEPDPADPDPAVLTVEIPLILPLASTVITGVVFASP
jgi:hypothetical protein